ncbi:AraC family transcriptional regulator [Actinoplanes sp. Pm04-4]|uniref:AraC family transcriptional regulator n=1 Tax=Paractinoplanes pyxinae TaxID=2997416 RepID=A0ABT4AV65_9ACTN|nr:AraC family transcriptional regulator [Actinoplanes pyxinae]MCY1138097.1 AraC family transcriptional regulator [Actinoplanes pyxinae]
MPLGELRDLLARHARPDLRTAIEDVQIMRADRPYPPAPTTYGKVFVVVAQGTKRCGYGETVYEYGAGQYLVASVDMPVTSHFSEAGPQRPGLGFGLTLHPAAVAEMLVDDAQAGGDAPFGLGVSETPPALLDAVVRLLRLLDEPADIPVLAPLIKREIIWRLIRGEQGAIVRQLGRSDSSLSHVGRAVRWIRDNYQRGFQVEEAAQVAGMSLAAFYRNFQAATAMTPIQFQKQIRLQQARLQLAADPTDIAGVSRRVGYDSPSQFSRDYRRQFGLPPSQDTGAVRPAARRRRQ